MSDTKLSEPIGQCSRQISSFVEQCVGETLLLDHPISTDQFQDFDLEDSIELDGIDYGIQKDEESNEEEKQQVDMFNQQWLNKTRSFILANAFSTVLQTYIEEMTTLFNDDELYKSDTIKVGVHSIPVELREHYNKICILLDYSIHLVDSNPEYKKIFYQLVLKTSKILFDISTQQLEVFWYYLESRTNLIRSKVFDNKVITDRICILEITNPLIDKFYNHYHTKKDSTKKDTFNDKIHSRVAIFVNRLFQLEDNTGLNKFFLVSNTVVPQILPRKTEKFISDILYLLKIIRDPFTYLKYETPRQSKEFTTIVTKIFEKLMKDEIAYISRKPSIDQFKVTEPKSEAEAEYLTQKYNNRKYFPELYFQSTFNKDPSSIDKEKVADQNFLYDLFDDHIFRETFLLQLYCLCCTISELSSLARSQFMSDMPPSAKHISDETVSDNTFRAIYRIKKDMISQFRLKESQFGFLLINLASTEVHWWKWLIYGKDPNTNKPLLTGKALTDDDINTVVKKFNDFNPERVQKYFNNYATPQLSRRMKGLHGLSNIKFHVRSATDIDETMDLDTKNILIWKKIRGQRQSNWLNFGQDVNDGVINTEVAATEDGMEVEPTEVEPATKKQKLDS